MLRRITTLVVIILLTVAFSKVYAQANVTFQVDMNLYLQLTTGGFNPVTDSVVVRGDWEHYVGATDWSGYDFLMTKSSTNDSVYQVTVPFPDSVKGKVLNYKFVLVHAGTDTWEGIANNRTYTVTSDANQQIPLVYFNDKLPGNTVVNITFEADMTALLNEGFNPATDSIEVRGDTPPLNWGPGSLMQQDLLNPTSFKVTLSFTGNPGTPIQWKFHCDPQSKFSNTGWENITDNHIVYFPKADTTVGPIAPVIQVSSATTAPDSVIFSVNMNGAHETYHNSLITGLKGVWVGGSVLPLQWPTSWLITDTAANGTLIKLYDDGTHGDGTAGDNIYSTTIVFPTGSGSPVYYKYGAVFSGVDTLNGANRYLDNEAPQGMNHTLSLNVNGGKQNISNMYGDQVTGVIEVKTGNVPTHFTLSQNYPNPFNPTTVIDYTVPKGSFVTLKVYNVLGQEVSTLYQGFQNAGTYKASFDASRLASGIYLYRLESNGSSITKKMILMK